jgi:TatD DNase family protein
VFVDIHTHNFHVEKNHLNFLVGSHSLGIHPWELNNPFDIHSCKEKFNNLKNQLSSKVLAIGECGLDRRREGLVSIEIQEKILEWHMDWALEVKLPIVIHCVRAYSDLLKILKTKKYRGKILLHDYSENLEMAQALLHYDCYFSFGARLFKNNLDLEKVFQSLPLDKIFLETDDQKVFNIEAIYEKAQSLLNMNEVALEERLMSNLTDFFSDLDNISTADVIDNLSLARTL